MQLLSVIPAYMFLFVFFAKQFQLPRLPELYFNRHNNKVAFVDILKYSRYQFFTMLQGFTMHHWHPRGGGKGDDEKDKQHLKELDGLLYSSRGRLEQGRKDISKPKKNEFDEGVIF